MARIDSDIIEIKLLDPSYTVFFKDKARIKDKTELNKLNESLEIKVGLNLIKKQKKGWFD